MNPRTRFGLRATLAASYRALMADFPTGVAIVTAMDTGGVPRGMTCSSVCSVTLRPPTLLVCLRHGSPTLAAIVAQRTFSVNLLHEHAQEVAELFASGLADRFTRVRWSADAGRGGPHLDDHAHATADCEVSQVAPVGDHVVIFGEVRRIVHRPAERPLLYGRRRYAVWPYHGDRVEPDQEPAVIARPSLQPAAVPWDGHATSTPLR